MSGDAGAAPPAVAMTGISKSYPGVRALIGVSLALRAGEIHALAGENGSGKSTLAKILYGAVRPDAGRIELGGEPVALTSPRAAQERGIVAISQELTLAPTLTVAENVLLGRLPRTRLGWIDWPAARRQARSALDELDVHVDPRARVGDLSVELQQEIEIARAISAESGVLVLDEATSSLSEAATTRLLTKLEQLRRRGVAILFITHRLAELYQCADRVTVLRDGHRVGEFPLPTTPESQLVRSMVGRPVSDLYRKRRVAQGEPLLAVSGLGTPDGSLRDVGFELRRGEILGVAGLVGSGKAELGLALGGAIHATGEVTVRGAPARLGSPRRALASGIAFVPDDRKRLALLLPRSVQENLSLAWLARLARLGVLNIRRERRMAEESVTRFAVRTRSLDALVRELSGGNQQKVVLGRWFTLGLDVVVLSEPTRGIDVGAKSEVYGFIQELAEAGKGVVMISSELPELLGVADRILVMFRGRVRAEFESAGATEEQVAHVAVTGALPEAA
jgi:ABC-type sugar transport system ATPase subunit